MRVRLLRLVGVLEHPVVVPSKPGFSFTTTVRGALESVAWREETFRGLSGLLKSDSAVYPGQGQSSITLGVVENGEPTERLSVALGLWGERAITAGEAIVEALSRAGDVGQYGFDLGGRRVGCRFERGLCTDGTLGDHLDALCERWRTRDATRVTARFVTPCEAPAHDLAALAGDAALALVRLQMTEGVRGRDDALRARVDALADAARDHVRASFAGTREVARSLGDERGGTRRSRSTGRRYPVRGREGTITLAGELAPCLPWLALLTLWGAGGRRSLGMGRVEVTAE